jgi:hypothetical protein
VNNAPPKYGSPTPDGGYDDPRTDTSPSSAPATTPNDNDDCAGGAATTTPLATDDTDAEPAEFDAVTSTRNDDPTSTDCTKYDDPDAPATSTHPPPDTSHRRH